ncbi:hypothetical protein IW252_002598 [Zhihengliuella flava]|uniref:Uncharacterized protein n=1 Tax=Zhihengliuella flava TaxID=1285193 RepID=A0A931DE03_9MICC|nr:hypothetical protein [Zhihengliuella flava]
MPTNHVTAELVDAVARHPYDSGKAGVPWEVVPDAMKYGLREIALAFLNDAVPVLLAAGWSPPREIRSAANDLVGLQAKVYDGERGRQINSDAVRRIASQRPPARSSRKDRWAKQCVISRHDRCSGFFYHVSATRNKPCACPCHTDPVAAQQ